MAKLTRGLRVCAFIERYLSVPEGDLRGQPIRLDVFQRKFILAVYDNPVNTKRAYLSTARKNAKTATIACLLLAHIAGPEAVMNSRIISGAMSKEQAAEVYNYASKMVGLSPELSGLCRIIPSTKKIIGLRKNVEYQAISAEGKTAHGKSPVLAILDEVGQVDGPHSDFVEAIETSQGAYSDAMLFAISTQAAKDDDLFSVWLDDAARGEDASIVSHVYAAPAECELSDKAAWAASNPALGKFRSLADLEAQAARAERMPSFESSFRRLCLNQRVAADSPFVSKKVWQENGAEPAPIAKQKVWGGLDLASVSDLCAFVALSDSGDVWPTFWLPSDGLAEKAKQDKWPYDVWHKQGLLETTPGRSVEYEYVAHRLLKVFEQFDVQQIAFDRYNMRHLRPWLVSAGFTERQLEKFVEFGQGFVSMGPALREFESMLLGKKMKHGMHPVLTMCAANAKVVTDPAGNRKFTKHKTTGRIDGMVALAMAKGCMPMQTKPTGTFQIFHV